VAAIGAGHRGAFDSDVQRGFIGAIRGSAAIPARAGRLADARRTEPCLRVARGASDAIVLRASHDGYAPSYGMVHERIVTLAADGTRLEGEDLFLAADGGSRVRSSEDRYAVRFHLHPSVKATRLTDGHGVLLMMPNKEVWTFSAGENRVQLEDSSTWPATTVRAARRKWSSTATRERRRA
jgi:uncharacterized heparinase superfamily protein